jgi:hypothetical protein
VGLGVVGIMIVGATSTALKDKKFINCFPEKISSPLTGQSKTYVTKRPGWAALNTPAAGQLATALTVWSVSNDEVISAFGSTNSTIYSGTSSLGAITGMATGFAETILAGTANLLIPSTNNTAWFYPAGGALTQIVDADFPGNVAGQTITGNFVIMDGFAYIMTTSGRIYNSDLNSISSWTSASFREANMYPDKGIGLARFKNLLVAFGKETVEFFYNSGQNPVGSPLDRYEQGFVHFGCLNQYSFTQLEDTLAWVSASDRSGIGVYILDGLQPKRISTPAIDTQLSLVNTNSVFMGSLKIVGKTFIVITTSSTTFVYCVEDEAWHEWLCGNNGQPAWHHISGTSSGTRLVYSASRSMSDGKIYIINPGALQYADDSSVINMIIQSGKFDGDTINNKFVNRVTVVGDQTATSALVTISWSDDDYQNFTNGRTVDMSTPCPSLKNVGKFRRRAWKISNQTNVPIRIEALEFELRQGIH